MKKLFTLIMVAAFSFAVVSCDNKSEKEKAEDQIEEAAEETEDAVEEAAEETEDAVEDAAEEVEEGGEEMEEEMEEEVIEE